MAIIKCKMCGGELEIIEGSSTARCEYCDSLQTIPKVDDEKKLVQFERAERLRKQCEFDKAAGIYETIVADFREEAEAYWGLVLCKFGIEYVDDPGTGKKIPTCHRSSFDSVMDDPDLEQALENADPDARRVYREEAKAIEELRKGIISVSSTEKPYDIFICYKETDPKGDRTEDSVIAQDVYDKLTERGYRVFFSRITLEDKLGLEYEPYIFAALNSAKIMLVFATDYEYLHAVWVKNEWSRYLKLMAQDKEKHLIPCFKGIDAYDMPKEFTRLQGQDFTKIGAAQDLLRGIEKILPRQTVVPSSSTVIVTDRFGTGELLERVKVLLQHKKWKSVQDTCKEIEDKDPENAWGYVYQLARVMRATDVEDLGKSVNVLSESKFYSKAMKYADPDLAAKLQAWCAESEENARQAEELCTPGRLKAEKVRGLLAGGKQHTAAVCTDGTVLTTGDNSCGQCNTGTWRNIIAVVCGAQTTIGLRSDGTVVACGDNEKGQCNVEQWTDIVAIACDDDFTLGLKADGTVVGCGNNCSGQLDVSGWTGIRSISCGYRHSIGQKADGTVVSIGSDNYGQRNLSSWAADVVFHNSNNIQSLGLRRNGTVTSAGCTDDDRISVKNWRNIVDVSMGTHHSVGLRTDGTVVACGSDGNNKCSGTQGWTDVIGVANTFWHTLAIRSDGTVLACGDQSDGKCNISGWKLFNSIDTLEEERIEAQLQRTLQDELDQQAQAVLQHRQNLVHSIVATGQEHILMVHSTGRVVAQGKNDYGQCNVQNWWGITAVACGEFFSVGLREDGTVVACGKNEDHQCDVSDWRNIIAIACGYDHTVGLCSDGTVVSCGNSDFNKRNLDSWTDIKAISCGAHHTVGLRKDGTVIAAGSNHYGQCNIEKWRNITAIATHNVQTVGLQADGLVLFCGDTEDNRGDVANWRDIQAIDCGSHHTIGMKSDGSLVSCGYNSSERCSGTRTWTNLAGVVCGYWCTIGVPKNGNLLFCGRLDEADPTKVHLFNDIDTIESKRQRYIKNKTLLPILCRNWTASISNDSGHILNDQGIPVALDPDEASIQVPTQWKDVVSLSGGLGYVAGLKKNGTVVCAGDLSNGANTMENWEDIVQLTGSSAFQVGLKADGTVVAFGLDKKPFEKLSQWKNIKRIFCSYKHVVGLRHDGTVVTSGNCSDDRCYSYHIENWTNITDVSCKAYEIMGLRKDGTVLSDFLWSDDQKWETMINKWHNIVQISNGADHYAGLQKDGTVVACGANNNAQCNVQSWRDIVSIACGYGVTIGLTKYNMVFACGEPTFVKNVNGMANVLAIASDGSNVYILKADGTVISGHDENICKRKIYSAPEFLADEKTVCIPTDPVERMNIHNQILKKQQDRRNSGLCQHCGGQLKGLFSKKCDNCGMPKDY